MINGVKKDECLYHVWNIIKNNQDDNKIPWPRETENQLFDSSNNEVEEEQENIQVEVPTINEVPMKRPPGEPRESSSCNQNEDAPKPSTSTIEGTPPKDVPTPFKSCLFWPNFYLKYLKEN